MLSRLSLEIGALVLPFPPRGEDQRSGVAQRAQVIATA